MRADRRVLSIQTKKTPFPFVVHTTTRWTAAALRKACPCATCREKKRGEAEKKKPAGLPVLSMAEARPLRIDSMRPVGNYAYNLSFSDGHGSGIFSLAMLHEGNQ